MKVVVFDVWGDLALFRRFDTNTSMLTHSFPPPTAVLGMVGAILGLDRDIYIQQLQGTRIGIELLHPVKKVRMALNYKNTKGRDLAGKKGRTQIPAEFIKDPAYRIYIVNDTVQQDLGTMLKEHKSVFTLSLGLSELLANFQYVGTYSCEFSSGKQLVGSVVPTSVVESIDFFAQEGKPKRMLKERVPVTMAPDRTVTRYEDVVIEENGEMISGVFSEVFVIGEKAIVFF